MSTPWLEGGSNGQGNSALRSSDKRDADLQNHSPQKTDDFSNTIRQEAKGANLSRRSKKDVVFPSLKSRKI